MTAMLSSQFQQVSVALSYARHSLFICQSHAGIASKLIAVGSWHFHQQIAQRL